MIYQRLVPRIGGGLVAAYEVLMANHAVRNLVREGKTRQLRNVVSTHQSEGMQTLEMGLNALMDEDLIEYETALRVSLYPKELERPKQYAGVHQYLRGRRRPVDRCFAPSPPGDLALNLGRPPRKDLDGSAYDGVLNNLWGHCHKEGQWADGETDAARAGDMARGHRPPCPTVPPADPDG